MIIMFVRTVYSLWEWWCVFTLFSLDFEMFSVAAMAASANLYDSRTRWNTFYLFLYNGENEVLTLTSTENLCDTHSSRESRIKRKKTHKIKLNGNQNLKMTREREIEKKKKKKPSLHAYTSCVRRAFLYTFLVFIALATHLFTWLSSTYMNFCCCCSFICLCGWVLHMI